MFQNRISAGNQLAKKLISYKNKKDVLVLGMPRGGVVVAYEISRQLSLPFMIIGAKKMGAPQNPELAIGAVSEEKTVVWNEELINNLQINDNYRNEVLSSKDKELREQVRKFRHEELNIKDKNIILVDDGIATGLTAAAAIKYCRKKMTKGRKLILAVPVTANDSFLKLKTMVDELICLETHENFYAVAEFYKEFGQVSDEEVVRLVKSSK